MSKADGEIVTVAQLRAGIDAGLTRDKVAAQDPAAAPLGTDDEAAGFPPTAEEVRLEGAALPQAPPKRRRDIGFAAYLGAVVAIALLILIIAWIGQPAEGAARSLPLVALT